MSVVNDSPSPVLLSRYEIVDNVDAGGDITAHRVVDADGYEYLARVWHYEGSDPDAVQRALWDHELRTLYRLGSTPSAEQHLMVLRDAGIDRSIGGFVMILSGAGYVALSSLLDDPSNTRWLGSRSNDKRAVIWCAIRSLADGLGLIHRQRVLHRRLTADCVFLRRGDPASMRLGGFEWSVRLGAIGSRDVALSPWTSIKGKGPSAGFQPEDDWYAFGTLATRLVLNVENSMVETADHPADVLLRCIDEAEGRRLSTIEANMLRQLIDVDDPSRLTHHEQVVRGIDEIVRLLSADDQHGEARLILAIDPKSQDLLAAATEAGFELDDDDGVAFNPQAPAHVQQLTAFFRRALYDAELQATNEEDVFVLQGETVPLVVRAYEDKRTGASTWQTAFCSGPARLSLPTDGPSPVSVPKGSVSVRTVGELFRDRAAAADATLWSRYLPSARQRAGTDHHERLMEFLKITNQVEAAIRWAEIFPYRLLEHRKLGATEEVDLAPADDPDGADLPDWCRIDGGMITFLSGEYNGQKRDSDKVVLSDDRMLTVQFGHSNPAWTIVDIDEQRQVVRLRRAASGGPAPESTGFIRTFGLAAGQVPLIRRRAGALERMGGHTYLLKALTEPGRVYMDTRDVTLPVALPEQRVDEHKRAAIEDILRVRPMYALQGPPGTGKTTTVAWLLREIIGDDPVAQVLVTSQAHDALDVLRRTVDDLFSSVAVADRPLAVRLGSRRDGPGDPQDTSAHVLDRSIAHLERLGERTRRQDEWMQLAIEYRANIRLDDEDLDVVATIQHPGARDFVELVKTSANLTYCTTSAGDLEALAVADHSFDWSIIEESGKAHGFDLALPLWAGHRWLLIGDQAQLPPYRFEDYRSALSTIDQTMEILRMIASKGYGAGVIDRSVLSAWDRKDPGEQASFVDFADRWLATFARIFRQGERASGAVEPLRTGAVPVGAAVGRLSGQHRMHPQIGTLVSELSYDGQLINRTVDEAGEPLDRVSHGLIAPPFVGHAAIVWLDLPSALDSPDFSDSQVFFGRENASEIAALEGFLPRLRRDAAKGPLTFAALSPYARQRSMLQRRLSREGILPDCLLPVGSDHARDTPDVAFTVDAFQGNQAGVVAVSLVRNNTADAGKGLGFLDRQRMNVLLSRAERLLVLVGSFDFFLNQVSTVDPDDIGHKHQHWRTMLDILDEWFDDGRAVRVDSVAEGLL